MASSEQIRKWYHDGVVLNHHQRGTSGYEPICNHNHPKVGIPNDSGGVYNEPVHPLTVKAWNAYVTVMNHHGETITSAGGINHCRNIGDTNWPSLHAYLCALDSPPNSRKSSAFIADIEKIRTNNGAQVFRNLAGDRMHDQINCSPADLATEIDWTTVIGESGDMKYEDIYKKWVAADIIEMKSKGLWTGDPAFYINDIGTWAHTADWENLTAVVLAADAALPPTPGPKGDRGDTGTRGSKGIRGATGEPGADGADGADGTGLDPGDTLNLSTTATVLP